jgi:competence CoiA-like predicted nuclease
MWGIEIVIEIQNSPIDIPEIDKRNTEYARLNTPILWLLPNKLVPKVNYKMECKTTHWQRYLHEIYDEKIYFHVSGLDVFPLHYENVIRKYSSIYLDAHTFVENNRTLINTKRMKMYKNLNIVDDFSFTMYEHIARDCDINSVYFLLWADEHGLWWNTKDSGVK